MATVVTVDYTAKDDRIEFGTILLISGSPYLLIQFSSSAFIMSLEYGKVAFPEPIPHPGKITISVLEKYLSEYDWEILKGKITFSN